MMTTSNIGAENIRPSLDMCSGIEPIFEYNKGDLKFMVHYSSEQVASNTIVLAISVKTHDPKGYVWELKTYPIRFMDVEGNPLDQHVQSMLRLISNHLLDYYGYKHDSIKPLDEFLIDEFYEKYMDIVITACTNRKKEVINFFEVEMISETYVSKLPIKKFIPDTKEGY